ncbi:MAG TPA: HAD family hydrolase [Anaerolinea sp.]|nr:HAD family hydrolase [Anaerolinea sp.]
MPKFSVALFDLGATLIYFDGDWEAALALGIRDMRDLLASLGYPVNDTFLTHYRETAREYYRWRDDNLAETPAPQVFREIMAKYCCDDLPEAHVKAALASLYAATQARWKVEDDAQPTLERLRAQGYRIGLVSNAGYDEDVQVLVDRAGLRPYLEYMVTSAAAGVRKPHPEIFEGALNFFGVRPEQAVMIGDFLRADVLGANRLGMGSVWTPRRIDLNTVQPYREKIQPDRTIAVLGELPDLLSTWE